MKHFSKFLNETYHVKEEVIPKQKNNDGVTKNTNITSFMRSGLVILSIILLASIAVAYGNKNIDGNSVKSVFSSRISNKELPIYCVDTQEKKVALSFDAAWGNEDTKKILNILKKNDVHVTFFMTGGWVESYPDDVKAIAKAGHELGNHSENHKQMSTLSAEECREEIMSVHEKVKKLTGTDMRVFRPPYGDYNDNLISVVKDCGYNAIQWDVDVYATDGKTISFLSKCLEKYHKQKVIILLDEYDVPLENAYFNGFYDKMVSFIRSLFESALKTNDSLKMAVVTGCLRISKESIFTGLNNLKVVSVLDESYAEYFGFTQHEVDALLDAYNIIQRKNEVQNWYDGYLFGNTEVYNPWSVINYVSDITYKNTEFPKPYWSNTSSNNIVYELIENSDDAIRRELENLIAGNTIEKPIHEDITYADIYKSQDNLWNFLFFTGYLKAVEKRLIGRKIYLSMFPMQKWIIQNLCVLLSKWL